MKKILIALVASVALVLGTGAFVSGASAAYPGTVPTKPTAPGGKTVTTGSGATVTIKVGAGNNKAGGKVIVVISGKKYTAKVVNGVAKLKFKAPKGKKGTKKRYTVQFKPYTGSIYKPSSTKLVVTFK